MPRPNVIVIDDDRAALSSVVALFRAFRFGVTSFDSAEAFLAADSSTECDCLILDVQLPGMNGRELLKKLKFEGYPAPIVLISGHADSAQAAESVQGGASVILEKPIDPQVLVAHVQQAIHRDSSQ